MERTNVAFISFSRYFIRFFIIAFGVIAIMASGGGGGGDNNDDSNSNGNNYTGTLQYVGNTNPAIISAKNATYIIANFFNIWGPSDELPMASLSAVPQASRTTSKAMLQTNRMVSGIFNIDNHQGKLQTSSISITGKIFTATSKGFLQPAEAINETDQCPSGGNIVLTGDIDDQDGTGTLTMTYNSCGEYDEVADGIIVMRIDKADVTFGWLPTDSTLMFKELNIKSQESEIIIDGTMRDYLNSDGSETLTLNMVLKNNVTQEMQKYENVVITDSCADSFYLSETITGRFYDSIDGYLDIVSLQPQLYAEYDGIYPSSGQLLFTGANNTHLRITSLPDDMAFIELDLNSDNIYEVTGEISWEVINKAGTDPNDADGDGLPDSWETTYGLSNSSFADVGEDSDEDALPNYEEYLSGTNPTNNDSDSDGISDGWEVEYGLNPLSDADASIDLDGDNAINIQEYSHNTDPKDGTSSPADLAITLKVSAPMISAQTVFGYTFEVTNLGPGIAHGIRVSDLLPDNIKLAWVNIDNFAYDINNSVYVDASSFWEFSLNSGVLSFRPLIDTLAAGEKAVITVPVIPLITTGQITNSATIESTSVDFNPTNDTSTIETSVVNPVLTQIDTISNELLNPSDVVISYDGKNLYTTSWSYSDHAIEVFSRDINDGTLTFIEAERDGINIDILQSINLSAMAISQDGKNVYLAIHKWGPNGVEYSIVAYNRDLATGELTYLSEYTEGVGGVEGIAVPDAIIVSKDGENVYVAGSYYGEIAVFNRNTTSGLLTYNTCVKNGENGIDGIAGITDLTLSPDDSYLYATGRNSNLDTTIATFSRANGGTLNYVDVTNGDSDAQMWLTKVMVSKDGSNLYILGMGKLIAYVRNSSNGSIAYLATYEVGKDGIVGSDLMYDIAISPNDKYLYTVGGGLALFKRDPDSGNLRFIEVRNSDIGGVVGLDATSVDVSPDNAFVYVTSLSSSARLCIFSIDLDEER